MKLFVFGIALLLSQTSLAASHQCQVTKSTLRYDSESKKLISRIATTALFEVTKESHEDETRLALTEQGGANWGEVFVGTGTYTNDSRGHFYAKANIVDSAGYLQTWLMLKMPKTASEASAATMILKPESDNPPTLSLDCFLVARR